MKVVAVIGGTGFLGRHVVEELEKTGHSVRVFSRRIGFDALRPDPEALRGVDAVVNLAGIKREDGRQTFQAVHVDLVRNLIGAMKVAGVRRLIHISVVVARAAPGLPYHDSKWKGEEVVRASDLDWTILRPGVIYGDGDDMLTHLALMIRTAPIFPIVGDGASPMRPVDARDVAAAVVSALHRPVARKTYEIVGPDRLTLRDVVKRVAEAMELPLSIWSTPVALMRLPVRIMEATMQHPLSTRAQLSMLVEGLDGDPAPSKRDLDITTSPFTSARLRPLLAKLDAPFPFNLRLLSSQKLPYEIPATAFWVLLLYAVAALTVVFSSIPDRWMGMTVVMGLALVATLLMKPVRQRLKPSVLQIVTGLAAGTVLYGITRIVAALLPFIWPGWEASARTLYAWSQEHSPLFLGVTLVWIVLAEELLWRGVVTRFFMERWGRAYGIAAAAMVYALAHVATFNPLLLAAALGCGLFWGCLYSATDNLVAPIVSHLLWDVMLLFLFPVVR
jgi:uncharacterized protein YbjT (DUF2867 family)/membrane protease YdiL (CAAX protease family)